MSEYDRLIENVGKRRGRKPLPEAERIRREEARKADNRLRQEARRRAFAVLQHRYTDEFNSLLTQEYDALSNKS